MPTPKRLALPKIDILLADTTELKEKALRIRREVFVSEQKVSPEDEFDQFEDVARHFVALDNEEPVGAARWRTTDKGVKLERFAVRRSYRRQQVGAALVRAVMKDIENHLGAGLHLYLNSQVTAIPFYESFGFSKVGDQFEECNILHHQMELCT